MTRGFGMTRAKIARWMVQKLPPAGVAAVSLALDLLLNLLPMITDQLTVTGSIMGTLDDMERMINLIARTGIEPEIGAVLRMERAEEAFRAMWEGRTHGKTVFTR
jgi:D-arabinose 1-dehydrogenase-like Zn-dependent alcohol dehydrogenase